ncbi:uncharacterized protein METZ01_LOCUS295747, partial [marine metagenome]
CAICLRVCPWNRDFSKWPNRLWRWLAARGTRRWLIRLEGVTGRGQRRRSKPWWLRSQPGEPQSTR